jgi:hypothetical protein
MRTNAAMIGGTIGRCEHDRSGDRHLAALERCVVAHIANCEFQVFQYLTGLGQELLSHESERDHAGVPVKQAYADLRFQISNDYADGRLREVEIPGGEIELAKVGHRNEGPELPQGYVHGCAALLFMRLLSNAATPIPV